jgi:alkylation response protein AidB-like acyl-CoA dehydrogenase
MDFDLNAEQTMLKKSAREFFTKEVNSELVRELEADAIGHSDKIWKKMAKLGWLGLLVPEAYGGEEMNFLDVSGVLEEMGASALPGPYLTSCVTSALILLESASEKQKKSLLPDLSSGKKIFAVAWSEKNIAMAPIDIVSQANLRDGQYEISGVKSFVPYAHVSDYVIVAARTGVAGEKGDEGISLFLVDQKAPGLGIDVVSNSSGEKYCELTLNQVRIPSENLIGELGKGWNVLEAVFLKSAVAECAKMVGACEKMIKFVTEYAKKRVQFGRPIGSFQAIQHHCANMKTLLDTSALITQRACWAISSSADWKKESAMCKAWAGESLRQMIMLGHQVMGGFGFIEEVDLQLYYRRARTSEMLFGTSYHHRENVAREMGL